MMGIMDLFATIPLLTGAFLNMGIFAMNALAERLLTLALAGLIIGGVTVFAVTGFAWLWLKHTVGDLLHMPSTART